MKETDEEKDQEKAPILPPEPADTEPTQETTGENLKFNEQKGSYELDPVTEDEEYQHPDPYDTGVDNGGDHMSTFDEANQFTDED